MQIDYAGIFLQAIASAAESYGRVFAANPWPWLGIAAFLVTGWVLALLPKRRSAARRR